MKSSKVDKAKKLKIIFLTLTSLLLAFALYINLKEFFSETKEAVLIAPVASLLFLLSLLFTSYLFGRTNTLLYFKIFSVYFAVSFLLSLLSFILIAYDNTAISVVTVIIPMFTFVIPVRGLLPIVNDQMHYWTIILVIMAVYYLLNCISFFIHKIIKQVKQVKKS